jgi:hypothetical protein
MKKIIGIISTNCVEIPSPVINDSKARAKRPKMKLIAFENAPARANTCGGTYTFVRRLAPCVIASAD